MFIIISNPKQCPRFDWCNANLCPLDPRLHMRKYFQEELCFYVREFVKIQSGSTQQRVSKLEENILRQVKKHIDLMLKMGGAKYRYKVNRAKKYKSKKEAQYIKRGKVNLRGPAAEIKGSHDKEIKVA